MECSSETTTVPLEPVWSLSSSRFTVEQAQVLVAIDDFAGFLQLGSRVASVPIIVGPYEDDYEADALALLRVHCMLTITSGTLPWEVALEFAIKEDERSNSVVVDLNAWGLPECAFFMDVCQRVDDVSPQLEKIVIHDTIFQNTYEHDCLTWDTLDLIIPSNGETVYLELNLHFIHGLQLNPEAGTLAPSKQFTTTHDPCDFDACWGEVVDIVIGLEHFKVQKSLAEARIPYIAKFLQSSLRDTFSSQIELQIPNTSAKSFGQFLTFVIGGENSFAIFQESAVSPQKLEDALEILVIADFLGCEALSNSLQGLIVYELREISDIEVATMLLHHVEGSFPKLPKFAYACLSNASCCVLAELCRQCHSSYLEKLLRKHTVVDLQSLQLLAHDHVGKIACGYSLFQACS